MAEKPIIFSAPMVRAILDGRKTQTRRIIKPQPSDPFLSASGAWIDRVGLHGQFKADVKLSCSPGDLLWVREAWRAWWEFDKVAPAAIPTGAAIQYVADDPLSSWLTRLRPSIHMPRWASRITLKVTGVKVERLQTIKAEDTIAEGVQCDTCEAMRVSACHDRGCFASRQLFQNLWQSIHGPESWSQNPWVAAISFEPITAREGEG